MIFFFFLLPGEYLEKIIPLVVKFCNVDDDELREYCIQAFESFVRRQVILGYLFQVFLRSVSVPFGC